MKDSNSHSREAPYKLTVSPPGLLTEIVMAACYGLDSHGQKTEDRVSFRRRREGRPDRPLFVSAPTLSGHVCLSAPSWS